MVHDNHADPATPEAVGPEPAAWTNWSASEREQFFDAIARHRRNAWRVTLPCALASLLLALILAILLAPLLYGLLGLAVDVINLALPMPDLLGHLGSMVGVMVDSLDSDRPAPASAWLRLAIVAAVPGAVLMAAIVFALRRALMHSPLFHPLKAPGRPALPSDLNEQRFANTVAEMAAAAMIPAPRVTFVDGGANASAFGPDESHATVMAGTGLLPNLNRQQMQGIAAHLIASVADGDMKIGMRTAMTLGLFTLPAVVSTGWADRAGFAATVRLLHAILLPTPARLDRILQALDDPFRDRGSERDATKTSQGDRLTWRQWAMMPLVGPVVISGFLGGLVSTMMLAPAVALAWRHRKFMADANAVALTRDPDALVGALAAISAAGANTRLAAWAGHLCVVNPGTRHDASLLGGSYVSVFPPLQRRIRALVRIGADPQRFTSNASGGKSWLLKVLSAVLFTVIGSLMAVVVVLLIWISLALSGLFTLLPVALLHALLR